MPDRSRLLIVGIPRSGTTLLTSIVGYHPDCIAVSEGKYCEEDKIVSPAEVVANKLCCPNHVQLHHPPFYGSVQRIKARLFRQCVYQWWGESLAYLTGLVPKEQPMSRLSISDYVEDYGASLLFVLRKPDQVVDSMIRRGGISKSKAISRWAHGTREIAAAYSKYESSSHIVGFSSLVNDTGQEIIEVYKFLDLEHNKEITEGYASIPRYNKEKVDSSVADRKVQSYNLKTRQPKSYKFHTRLREKSQS